MDKPAPLPKPKVRAKYSSSEASELTQDIPDGGAPDFKIDLNSPGVPLDRGSAARWD